jgi:hypothetical protein
VLRSQLAGIRRNELPRRRVSHCRIAAILQSAREGRRIELPKVTAIDAFRGSRPG